MPTLCELAGAAAPKHSDGVSLVPTLLGKGKQKIHEFLYWEFHGYGGQQAVRLGDWKAIRKDLHKGKTHLYLYDLAKDLGEEKDISAEHPKIVEQITKIMADNHVPSKQYPIKALDGPDKKEN